MPIERKAKMGLADIMRASYIMRWNIVNTHEQQNVAEHSFNVAVIADRLYHLLTKGSNQRETPQIHYLILKWALWHDIPEVMTGDIPTPIKRHLEGKYPQCISSVESAVCPHYADIKNEIEGTAVQVIVKIADLLESISFLQQKQSDTLSAEVSARLRHRLEHVVSEAVAGWPQYNWEGAMERISREIRATPTTLDSIMERIQ